MSQFKMPVDWTGLGVRFTKDAWAAPPVATALVRLRINTLLTMLVMTFVPI